jgi:hypothetical protein
VTLSSLYWPSSHRSAGHSPGAKRSRSGETKTIPTTSSTTPGWATRQDYDNYLAWRKANGFTARFDEVLAQPMAIRYFDEAQAW